MSQLIDLGNFVRPQDQQVFNPSVLIGILLGAAVGVIFVPIAIAVAAVAAVFVLIRSLWRGVGRLFTSRAPEI